MPKLTNIHIMLLEVFIITGLMLKYIIPDWDGIPTVRDYFALMIIIELTFDIYNKLKTKL